MKVSKRAFSIIHNQQDYLVSKITVSHPIMLEQSNESTLLAQKQIVLHDGQHIRIPIISNIQFKFVTKIPDVTYSPYLTPTAETKPNVPSKSQSSKWFNNKWLPVVGLFALIIVAVIYGKFFNVPAVPHAVPYISTKYVKPLVYKFTVENIPPDLKPSNFQWEIEGVSKTTPEGINSYTFSRPESQKIKVVFGDYHLEQSLEVKIFEDALLEVQCAVVPQPIIENEFSISLIDANANAYQEYIKSYIFALKPTNSDKSDNLPQKSKDPMCKYYVNLPGYYEITVCLQDKFNGTYYPNIKNPIIQVLDFPLKIKHVPSLGIDKGIIQYDTVKWTIDSFPEDIIKLLPSKDGKQITFKKGGGLSWEVKFSSIQTSVQYCQKISSYVRWLTILKESKTLFVYFSCNEETEKQNKIFLQIKDGDYTNAGKSYDSLQQVAVHNDDKMGLLYNLYLTQILAMQRSMADCGQPEKEYYATCLRYFYCKIYSHINEKDELGQAYGEINKILLKDWACRPEEKEELRQKEEDLRKKLGW